MSVFHGMQNRKEGPMPPELANAALLRKLRIVLGVFMLALVLSGLTASFGAGAFAGVLRARA